MSRFENGLTLLRMPNETHSSVGRARLHDRRHGLHAMRLVGLRWWHVIVVAEEARAHHGALVRAARFGVEEDASVRSRGVRRARRARCAQIGTSIKCEDCFSAIPVQQPDPDDISSSVPTSSVDDGEVGDELRIEDPVENTAVATQFQFDLPDQPRHGDCQMCHGQ